LYVVVEEDTEGIASELQRASRDCADKPMFRDAFRRYRCVIPASGYYEWLKRPDGKQPYFISAADGGVLSFAGLWERWKNPETGEPVICCTIIEGQQILSHRPRLPLLLSPIEFVRRLAVIAAGIRLHDTGVDGDPDQIRLVLRSAAIVSTDRPVSSFRRSASPVSRFLLQATRIRS
jgi:SOS response associated peptidase (SRAP)